MEKFIAWFVILLIFVAVFFFWRRVFRRLTRSDSSRKRQAGTWLAVISTIVSVPALFLTCWYLLTIYPHRPFSKERWDNKIERRYEMAHSIVETGMLVGKTKDEVKQLLGHEGVFDKGDTWLYVLGFAPDHFLYVIPDQLIVYFNNGVVVRAEHRLN